MSNNKKINFQEISEKIDTLIDIVTDESLVESYPTLDLKKLVNDGFEEVTTTLTSLPDIDVHTDM